jgi:LPS export ABC transporter protein LptC
MRKAKILILILLVLITGGVLTCLWVNLREREASGEKEIVPAISTEGADMRLEKIRFVEDKEGRRTWELEAKLIRSYQDQNTMVLEDVTVTFYTKEGHSFVISGKKGTVHQDSKNIELVGDVQITSSDGYLLKTHSINYDHAGRKASTADPIEIEGKEIQLVGRGLQVDVEAKVITVLHQVKAQWKGGKG